MKTTRTLLCGATLVLAAAGCPKTEVQKPPTIGQPPMDPAARTARAMIEARSGSALAGEATFEERDGKVHVVVSVRGATPGQHAVHVHEKGDCSAPDASTAGGHFNPHAMAHGGPESPAHHAGDFGNLTVGEDGTGRIELDTDKLTVGEGPASVQQRAIVVHEKPDDLVTQPAGASGPRIGCGVIQAAPATPATP